MKARVKLGLITMLSASCAVASATFAADWSTGHHFDRPPESHETQAPPPPPPPPPIHNAAPDVRGPAPSHDFHAAPPDNNGQASPRDLHDQAPPRDFHGQAPPRDFRAPPSDFRGQLPSRDFHGVPPGFRGKHDDASSDRTPRAPRELRDRPPHEPGGVTAPRDFRHPPSGGATTPPAIREFVDRHDVNRFTPQQREAWTHGRWHHTWHHGHFGWWWFFNNFWFFYPEPFYPFPTYVGEYYDYYDDQYSGDDFWYWCDDPRGYYPYVQECEVDWIPVPPEPY